MICLSKHDRPEMESLGTNAACRPSCKGQTRADSLSRVCWRANKEDQSDVGVWPGSQSGYHH